MFPRSECSRVLCYTYLLIWCDRWDECCLRRTKLRGILEVHRLHRSSVLILSIFLAGKPCRLRSTMKNATKKAPALSSSLGSPKPNNVRTNATPRDVHRVLPAISLGKLNVEGEGRYRLPRSAVRTRQRRSRRLSPMREIQTTFSRRLETGARRFLYGSFRDGGAQ